MKSTRRSFIKRTAVAGSAVIAAPTIISSTVFGANDRINAAVLGVNGRGKSHIQGLMAQKNVQVTTLCDPDMNLLRDYEGTSLDSVRQMVASGLGLAILPALYVRSELDRGGDVAILDVDGWNVTRSIGAAWRVGAGFADEYDAISRRIADEARAMLEKKSAV